MMDFLKRISGPFVLVILVILARYLFPNKMTFIVEIITFSIYIMGNDILYGYMGMVSFGQPFYLGVGAYTAALYLAYLGQDPLVAMGLAILSGVLIAIILGPVYIRLRGDYFALINAATCAIGLFLVEKPLLKITRGDDGLWFRSRMAAESFFDLRQPAQFFWFAIILLTVVLLLYRWLDRSVLGASFRGIKVNEGKMKFLGYNTFVIRWIGYALSCVLAALAGSMYAVNFGFVNPSITDPARAAEVLVATLLGGAGTVYGAFLGTVAFLGIKDLVSTFITRWEFPVGVITMLVCFFLSRGVWGLVSDIFIRRKKDLPMGRPSDQKQGAPGGSSASQPAA
jgi:branched-chain amino acid transport system permease protein